MDCVGKLLGEKNQYDYECSKCDNVNFITITSATKAHPVEKCGCDVCQDTPKLISCKSPPADFSDFADIVVPTNNEVLYKQLLMDSIDLKKLQIEELKLDSDLSYELSLKEDRS